MFFQQAALLEHQQAKLIQEQIELQKAVNFVLMHSQHCLVCV